MPDAKLDTLRSAILREIDSQETNTHALALKAKVSPSTLYGFLRYGRTRSFTLETADRVAEALRKTVAELTEDQTHSPRELLVTGVIGAGAVVVRFSDHGIGGGMYSVEPPPGIDPAQYEALEVRGDSQRPMLENGWLVIYGRQPHAGVAEECIGKLCVVQLADGTAMVKRVRRGSQPGRYNLESVNADTIEDAQVEWASKVRWIEQR